jgi:hypothetical protein
MSKFLLNLLVQISKALVYSKIKFYSENFFPHFRPNRPSSQPAHPEFRPSSPNGPTGHLLPLPAPEPNAQGAAAGLPRTAPTVDPDALHRKKKMATSIPLHSPINRRHSPFSNTGNRRLQTGPLKLLQHRPLKALGLPHLASALL